MLRALVARLIYELGQLLPPHLAYTVGLGLLELLTDGNGTSWRIFRDNMMGDGNCNFGCIVARGEKLELYSTPHKNNEGIEYFLGVSQGKHKPVQVDERSLKGLTRLLETFDEYNSSPYPQYTIMFIVDGDWYKKSRNEFYEAVAKLSGGVYTTIRKNGGIGLLEFWRHDPSGKISLNPLFGVLELLYEAGVDTHKIMKRYAKQIAETVGVLISDIAAYQFINGPYWEIPIIGLPSAMPRSPYPSVMSTYIYRSNVVTIAVKCLAMGDKPNDNDRINTIRTAVSQIFGDIKYEVYGQNGVRVIYCVDPSKVQNFI